MIRPSIFNIIILLNFYFIIIGCKHTLPSQLAKPASTKPNSIQRESKYEVLFSTPQVTKCGSPQNGSSIEDKTINRKLESLIREAPEHSMIRCTLYSFTDKNIIDAIIKAHQRSVNIEILFDNKIKQSNYISTFNTLKPVLKDKVTACTKPSCARLIGNTHHKYCIFSKNRNNEENIIFQTTMNAKEVAKRFNDAIYITEDKELYDLYRKNWYHLKEQLNQIIGSDYLRDSNGYIERNDQVSVYFTPSRYSDPVLDFIENAEIDCTTKGSKILVSQSKWQKNRAKRLMNLLTTLHNRGCEVKAITNNADDANDYLDDLPSFNLPYPVMLFDRQKTANVDTHSKTLLIEANMKIGSEVSYKKVVFTGSANMSTFSLEYGDETIVRIIDDNVYDKFVDYWQKQEEIIKRCSN